MELTVHPVVHWIKGHNWPYVRIRIESAYRASLTGMAARLLRWGKAFAAFRSTQHHFQFEITAINWTTDKVQRFWSDQRMKIPEAEKLLYVRHFAELPHNPKSTVNILRSRLDDFIKDADPWVPEPVVLYNDEDRAKRLLWFIAAYRKDQLQRKWNSLEDAFCIAHRIYPSIPEDPVRLRGSKAAEERLKGLLFNFERWKPRPAWPSVRFMRFFLRSDERR